MAANKNNRNYERKKYDMVDINVWRKCQKKDKYYNVCKTHSAVWYYSVHFGIPFHRKILGDITYSYLSFCASYFLTMWKHVVYILRKRVIIRQNNKTNLILVFQAKIGFFPSRFTDSVMFLLFQPLPKQKVPKSKQTLQGQPKSSFSKCFLYFPYVLGEMELKNWVLMSEFLKISLRKLKNKLELVSRVDKCFSCWCFFAPFFPIFQEQQYFQVLIDSDQALLLLCRPASLLFSMSVLFRANFSGLNLRYGQ